MTQRIERINTYLLRHYRILNMVLIVAVFLLSIFLPYSTFIQFKANFGKTVDPAIINGILTATAIVFAFVAFELREIKASFLEKFLLSLPLLLFLMVTVEGYFIVAIVGKITIGLVFIATSNCLFNILYSVPILIAKGTHEELEKQEETLTKKRD